MCGRASLTHNEAELEERFQSDFYSEDIARYNPIPSYNVAPTHILPVITAFDRRHFLPAAWGWNRQTTMPFVINAQLEGIETKQMFKKYIDYQRCIIPMDGYYEWLVLDGQKIPYRVVCTDMELFGVAGLFKEEKNELGKTELSYVVITRPADQQVAWLHARMPLILTEQWENKWLDGEYGKDWTEILSGDLPYHLAAYPVSNQVNSVRNNSADLINKVDRVNYQQGDLFA
jgi:putative SOS response-associated peptidase YedK